MPPQPGFEAPLFPPLPHDAYHSSPDETVQDVILCGKGLQDKPSITLPLLQLGWAVVLAAWTGSRDVCYALAAPGTAVRRCQRRLHLHSTVAEVAKQILATADDDDNAVADDPAVHNVLVLRLRTQTTACRDVGPPFPLTVECTVGGTEVAVRASFDAAVVPRGQVQMMLDHLADVVHGAGGDPGQPLEALQTVGPRGQRTLKQWNQPPADLPDQSVPVRCIHDQINDQVRRAPTATAVSAWDGSLTYAGLADWADALATELMAVGVRPGDFVGIVSPKSRRVVVGLLATLKSGGAVVLLPASLPSRRLEQICERASVRAILGPAEHAATLAHLGRPVVRMTEAPPETRPAPPRPAVTPHHPLYAVFTSGSTGAPKGIIVDHAAFGAGYRGFCAPTGLDARTRLFQAVSYAYVPSVCEQLQALLMGACICLASESQLEDDLEGSLHASRADFVLMTPSQARGLRPPRLPHLRTLVLTGEPTRAADLPPWEAQGVAVYTCWGQSESCSTLWVRRVSPATFASAPNALGNLTCGSAWVVDPDDPHRLRPPGTEGELLLVSPGVACGYLDDPAQTATTFVPPPRWWSTLRPGIAPPGRCLRTGDLVRAADTTGQLEYLGRKDTVTKIRGQRVDLGEIEHHLRAALPHHDQLVVDVPIPAGTVDPVLVGFVVVDDDGLHGAESATDADSDSDSCLAWPTVAHRVRGRQVLAGLQVFLPGYLIPRTLLPVRGLPRTQTGKVDRKTLRDHAGRLTLRQMLAHTAETAAYRAPHTPAEARLRSLCGDVLSLAADDLGMEDNFLDLGGDSMTARHLVTAARAHGLFLSVPDVLRPLSLADLAARACQAPPLRGDLDGRGRDDPFAALGARFRRQLPAGLDPAEVADVYPATEEQTRSLRTGEIDYFPFDITGPLDAARLRQACEALVAAEPVLRSHFVPWEGQMMTVVLRRVSRCYWALRDGDGPDSVANDGALHAWLTAFCEKDRASLTKEEPLVAFWLVPRGPQHHLLVIRLSHAQYDGPCLLQIAGGLGTAYRSLLPPPAAAVDYFGQHRRDAARRRTLEAWAFWRNLLTGATVTRLPTRPPSPPRRDAVPLAEQTQFISGGPCKPGPLPAGVTLASAVKAAWAHVLSRETGQSDILFGQIVNGRPSPTGLGCCMNTTPVRVNLSTAATARDLLGAVQEQHGRASDFDTIEWGDMVAQATDWPAHTTLDSVVLHENFDLLMRLDLGPEMTTRMLEPVFALPVWPFLCLVTVPYHDQLAVYLRMGSARMHPDEAGRLVQLFVQTLLRFIAHPDGPVDEPSGV